MLCHATDANAAHIETTKETQMEKLLAEIPIKRITDQIRLHWGTAEGSLYLNSLLINDRDYQRAGFPPQVSSAIFRLIKLHEHETRPVVGEH